MSSAASASPLLPGMLDLGSVPYLLDPRPDVAFFFLDMMLQRLLQFLDLVNPLISGRIESIDFLAMARSRKRSGRRMKL